MGTADLLVSLRRHQETPALSVTELMCSSSAVADRPLPSMRHQLRRPLPICTGLRGCPFTESVWEQGFSGTQLWFNQKLLGAPQQACSRSNFQQIRFVDEKKAQRNYSHDRARGTGSSFCSAQSYLDYFRHTQRVCCLCSVMVDEIAGWD